MWRVYGGAVAVLAGIAALIEAYSHSPEPPLVPTNFKGPNVLGVLELRSSTSGWSQTAYDLARIGGWALIVLGAVTLIMGLIRHWQEHA
jgi:uncharacterized membrane protein HdeD (DUF308 family)